MKPTVRQTLAQNPNGLTIEEIRIKTGLEHRIVKQELSRLPVHFNNQHYHLVTSPEHRMKLEQGEIMPAQITNTDDKSQPKVRKKPFTPNLTKGYEIKDNSVRIFLDRRNNAKSITLTIDDLQELLNAVRKFNELTIERASIIAQTV